MSQLSLSIRSSSALESALAIASAGSLEERGAIFTRPEIVEFILDLAGYSDDKALHQLHFLEPSFGEGDFLIPAVQRLLRAWIHDGGQLDQAIEDLSGAIRAVEIHTSSFTLTQESLRAELVSTGIPHEAAEALLSAWLIRDDFLLTDLEGEFDFVVGNPPYVRQERIPEPLLLEYRERYATMYDRADLYIPFIERGLTLLSASGRLCYICPERWIKNTYGGPLRQFISEDFHLDAFVDMNGVDAFQSEVSAYPAIMLLRRGKGTITRKSHAPAVDRDVLQQLTNELLCPNKTSSPTVQHLEKVIVGNEPWLLQHNLLRPLIVSIETRFPLLEDAGCKVGIGVASGADRIFIREESALDIEESRKLPLATTRDLQSGKLAWSGLVLANPYGEDGQLVELANYPKLQAYYEMHRATIASRHCAKKAPLRWYRTIDRIIPGLADRPKLLIPDIQGDAKIVLDPGGLYPHHNLYYVISEDWNLHALRAVLLSSITRAFILSYATQMRGGFLRFQAQYLRRLRLPLWQQVPTHLQERLTEAGRLGELDTCDAVVKEVYGLSATTLQEIRLQVQNNAS